MLATLIHPQYLHSQYRHPPRVLLFAVHITLGFQSDVSAFICCYFFVVLFGSLIASLRSYSLRYPTTVITCFETGETRKKKNVKRKSVKM